MTRAIVENYTVEELASLLSSTISPQRYWLATGSRRARVGGIGWEVSSNEHHQVTVEFGNDVPESMLSYILLRKKY